MIIIVLILTTMILVILLRGAARRLPPRLCCSTNSVGHLSHARPARGISRARILIFFRAVFARIRRLRKSLQYSLAILQGKLTVSANLRKSPRNFHKSRADRCQNPGPRTSPGPRCPAGARMGRRRAPGRASRAAHPWQVGEAANICT